MALPPLPAPRPRRLLRAACYRGRPRARCALLSALAALLSLSAGAWLGCGGHEELLSRALLPLLPGPPPEPPGAPPLLPGADAFVLEPAACPCAAPTAPPARAPFLLVLVASAPGHGERRRAARESWAGPRWASGLPVRTVFAVGLPAEPGAQAALEREAARHGDLLQGRFRDAYRNLTLKTLAMLGWAATRCPAAAFVLKTDDDVFLNLPALAAHLRDEQRRGLRGGGAAAAAAYLGRVHWWVRPERDPRSRHHVPAALYPPAEGAFFPPYCSGTGYVLAGAALPALLAAARRVPLVPVEDVFVGLCARHAGLAPRHLPRMAGAAHFPLDGCCYREVLFSVHRVAPRLMEAAWEAAAPGQPACSAWQRALGLLRCRVLGWLWERSGGQEEQEAEAGA